VVDKYLYSEHVRNSKGFMAILTSFYIGRGDVIKNVCACVCDSGCGFITSCSSTSTVCDRNAGSRRYDATAEHARLLDLIRSGRVMLSKTFERLIKGGSVGGKGAMAP